MSVPNFTSDAERALAKGTRITLLPEQGDEIDYLPEDRTLILRADTGIIRRAEAFILSR